MLIAASSSYVTTKTTSQRCKSIRQAECCWHESGRPLFGSLAQDMEHKASPRFHVANGADRQSRHPMELALAAEGCKSTPVLQWCVLSLLWRMQQKWGNMNTGAEVELYRYNRLSMINGRHEFHQPMCPSPTSPPPHFTPPAAPTPAAPSPAESSLQPA